MLPIPVHFSPRFHRLHSKTLVIISRFAKHCVSKQKIGDMKASTAVVVGWLLAAHCGVAVGQLINPIKWGRCVSCFMCGI